MITKGYIQDVLSRHSVRVRIPLYNKIENVNGATPNKELSIAPICTVANIINDPHIGDIVFLAFEEDDISKPVVIGYLSLSNMGESLTDIKCDNFEAQGDTTLSKYTKIGEIDYENIFQLKGLTQNILEKFGMIDTLLEEINIEMGDPTTTPDTNTVWGSIADLSSRVGTEDPKPDKSTLINADLNVGKSLWENLHYIKHNYVDSNTPILQSGTAYGSKLPENPKDGQLYFMPLEDINFNEVTLYNT